MTGNLFIGWIDTLLVYIMYWQFIGSNMKGEEKRMESDGKEMPTRKRRRRKTEEGNERKRRGKEFIRKCQRKMEERRVPERGDC